MSSEGLKMQIKLLNFNHANWYDIFFGRFVRGLGRKVVESMIFDKSDSLLDVACGTGEQALIYARTFSKVTGLDLCEERLKRATEKAEENKIHNLRFLCGDATKMPFENNEFDYSSICLGLHAMNPLVRDGVLREMKRVSKKGIILVDYTTPLENRFVPQYHKLIISAIEKFATDKDHYTNFCNFMEEGGLPSLVKKHKLNVEEENHLYGLTIFKLSIS